MQYTYPFSNILTETGTVTRTRNIEFLYDCVNDPTIPCCDCFPVDGQIMYFIAGDVFDYQINETPDSLTVYNFDGTVIGNFNTWIFPNTIRVNVDDLDPSVNCFYLSVTLRGETICYNFGGFSRHIPQEIDYCFGGDCGIGTITIESSYSQKDCHSNRYDKQTTYSNKRRFLADVEYIGTIEDAKLLDDARISGKIYSQFQIRILQPLKQNSRLLSELTEVIMRGKLLTINIDSGFPVEVIDCVDYTEGITRSYDTLRDWYPVFIVRQEECDSAVNC